MTTTQKNENDSYEDDVVPQAICQRHGGPLDNGCCWECSMERDEAERDVGHHEAVLLYMRTHDERMAGGR